MSSQQDKMPRKTALRRDFIRSILHSKGRFLSIVGLMALGSFALVGLLVAGPDMRAAARAYFDDLGLADVTVISDLGLDEEDRAAIDAAPGASDIEYGYFKDVAIDGTTTSIRVMSQTGDLSQFELVDGRMPSQTKEIALDAALQDTYAIGDTIKVQEKPDSISGKTVLVDNEFEVVGFVNSPEIISIVNMGQSTAGTGSLKGYAVVTPESFDSDVYMMARLSYSDTAHLDPYSKAYRDCIQTHKSDLERLLAARPSERLAAVKGEAQQSIDEGQAEVNDARSQLSNAERQLGEAAITISNAQSQIESARNTLEQQTAMSQNELDESWQKLSAAKRTLDRTDEQLKDIAAQISDGEQQTSEAREQLEEGESAYAQASQQLEDSRQAYETAKAQYEEKNTQFQAAKQLYDEQWETVSAQWNSSETQDAWNVLDSKRDEIAQGIQQCEETLKQDPDNQDVQNELTQLRAQQEKLEQLDTLKESYEQLATFGASYESTRAALEDTHNQLESGKADLLSHEQELADKRAYLDASTEKLQSKEDELANARDAYEKGVASYNAGLKAYEDGLASWHAGKDQLLQSSLLAQTQIDTATEELNAKQEEYLNALNSYTTELPEAEKKISDAETELSDARERIAGLSLPVYDVDSRSETPSSDAYGTYETISKVIDSLARVFPVFLYLVAALVTLTTMTRMVDEERVISGTFKALGYSDADVARKFVMYGALAGITGSVIGIVLGHTLLPLIVYGAYGHSFTLPPIHLAFYPKVTILALVLAVACSVLPAWIAARRELRAQPAELLLPKAPRSGSKILLEHIHPIWNRLSFTHKVTARNLFRYKQRMFMTILGVAGAVAILVTGFGVQASIQQMDTRQFGSIIHYDLIVANAPSATTKEADEVTALLDDPMVKNHAAIHYESISKVAGENGERQDITLIVPEDTSSFSDYLSLEDRTTGKRIGLSKDGAVISERLASLLGLQKGDTLEFTDDNGVEHSVVISDITEMYIGHFMFLSPEAYEAVFGTPYSSNASLVTLKDRSSQSVENAAAQFMDLAGVKGVVQNTALQNQVRTIVDSLDKIMGVLILVASMLGVVIMYNLTNLNVSERMRELSTIKVLGFHTNETTMYIYRETIILTILGVLVGFGVGVALHEYVLWVVPPDNVMFDPALSAIEFVVPTIVITVIVIVLYFVVLHRLRHVDMLEALKSVD